MHKEGTDCFTSFCVELVLEVTEELFESVKATASRNIVNVNRRFENGRHLALMLDFIDALHDQLSDLAAHNLRDLTAIAPKDVGDFLLTFFATVVAHVEVEVLVDHQRDELTLSWRQVVVTLSALVHYDISQLSLNFLNPCEVFLCEL